MATQFKLGDLVRIRQNARTTAPGIHEVVGVGLSGRERVYRVRGGSKASERTVQEGLLRRA